MCYYYFNISIKDISPDHCIDIGAMLSACNGTESAEVPDMLELICNAIYASEKLPEFICIEPNEGMEWLSKKCPKASNLLNSFIKRHSHRAIKEVIIIG